MKDLLSYILTVVWMFMLILVGGLLQDLQHTSECQQKGITSTYVWGLKLSCSVIKDTHGDSKE